MSTTSKVTIFIIVIIFVIAVIWGLYSVLQQPQAGTTVNFSQNQANQNTEATSSLSDTSDDALNSDLSSIDNQIKDLNTDSANVDQSLNQ